ncbi:MAG: hypothetical protein R3C28_12835 [Pirellulaceae bacterium]
MDCVDRVGGFDFPSSVVQETPTDAKYRELLKLLQPGDELWRSIPWQIDLLEAQRMAATAQKPIFIWAMDGHPLSCEGNNGVLDRAPTFAQPGNRRAFEKGIRPGCT